MSHDAHPNQFALLREVLAYHHGLADFAFVMQGLGSGPIVLAAYHPSQQNTFTGKLTPAMLESVLRRAIELAAEA